MVQKQDKDSPRFGYVEAMGRIEQVTLDLRGSELMIHVDHVEVVC